MRLLKKEVLLKHDLTNYMALHQKLLNCKFIKDIITCPHGTKLLTLTVFNINKFANQTAKPSRLMEELTFNQLEYFHTLTRHKILEEFHLGTLQLTMGVPLGNPRQIYSLYSGDYTLLLGQTQLHKTPVPKGTDSPVPHNKGLNPMYCYVQQLQYHVTPMTVHWHEKLMPY